MDNEDDLSQVLGYEVHDWRKFLEDRGGDGSIRTSMSYEILQRYHLGYRYITVLNFLFSFCCLPFL